MTILPLLFFCLYTFGALRGHSELGRLQKVKRCDSVVVYEVANDACGSPSKEPMLCSMELPSVMYYFFLLFLSPLLLKPIKWQAVVYLQKVICAWKTLLVGHSGR